MALFSPYVNEDVAKLLRQAIESDKCNSETIRQLANNLGLDIDTVKKTVNNVRESYKDLKHNEITI